MLIAELVKYCEVKLITVILSATLYTILLYESSLTYLKV